MTPIRSYLLASSIVAAALPGLAAAQVYPNKPVRPIKDFVHISNVAATSNVIAVHPSFAAKDYKTFVDTLQMNPGEYSYGSAGNGSVVKAALADARVKGRIEATGAIVVSNSA